jgi:hypothetical protein
METPIVLLKLNENAYKILTVCKVCKGTKAKFLPRNSVPYEFRLLDSRETYLNYVPVENEMVLIGKILKFY